MAIFGMCVVPGLGRMEYWTLSVDPSMLPQLLSQRLRDSSSQRGHRLIWRMWVMFPYFKSNVCRNLSILVQLSLTYDVSLCLCSWVIWALSIPLISGFYLVFSHLGHSCQAFIDAICFKASEGSWSRGCLFGHFIHRTSIAESGRQGQRDQVSVICWCDVRFSPPAD